MRIQTERLLLKEITENDFSPLFDLMTNGEVKKTYLVPDFENENAFMKTFLHLKKLSQDENGHTAGIFLGNELIGLFHKVDTVGDRVEVGYAIHPRFQNQGYATEALQAGIRYFFEKGFCEVYAGAFQTNPASLRVMEKAGMQKTKMKASVRYRGKTHSCVYYSVKAKRNDFERKEGEQHEKNHRDRMSRKREEHVLSRSASKNGNPALLFGHDVLER